MKLYVVVEIELALALSRGLTRLRKSILADLWVTLGGLATNIDVTNLVGLKMKTKNS